MNRSLSVVCPAIAIGLSVVMPIYTSTVTASPKRYEACQPVARIVETKKLYCASELKSIKATASTSGRPSQILCFVVRKVFPIDQLLRLEQCLPQESGYQFDSNQRMRSKPKSSATALAILKPMGNLLMSSQPSLAWNSIPKAASYRVTLERGGQWVWSQETHQTTLQIPPNHPLQQDYYYKISVVAFGIDDQVISEQSKSVKLVDPKILMEIDDALFDSKTDSPNSLVKRLDKAVMLYHSGLVDEAVSQLELLMKFQDPAVYLQLGLIYKEVGQSQIAQDYLNKATELANRQSKPLSQFK